LKSDPWWRSELSKRSLVVGHAHALDTVQLYKRVMVTKCHSEAITGVECIGSPLSAVCYRCGRQTTVIEQTGDSKLHQLVLPHSPKLRTATSVVQSSVTYDWVRLGTVVVMMRIGLCKTAECDCTEDGDF